MRINDRRSRYLTGPLPRCIDNLALGLLRLDQKITTNNKLTLLTVVSVTNLRGRSRMIRGVATQGRAALWAALYRGGRR